MIAQADIEAPEAGQLGHRMGPRTTKSKQRPTKRARLLPAECQHNDDYMPDPRAAGSGGYDCAVEMPAPDHSSGLFSPATSAVKEESEAFAAVTGAQVDVCTDLEPVFLGVELEVAIDALPTPPASPRPARATQGSPRPSDAGQLGPRGSTARRRCR